ncbi:MAG: CHAT domain-containing protein, partial [Waterburya sp.]
ETSSNSLNPSLAGTGDSLHLGSSTELEKSRTLLAELYQLLIEPIESFLNTSSANKVILIPHGTLFLIPFATLLNPKTNQYLIEQYSIILSPSLQTLNLTQQNYVNASEVQNILVVGNPQMPSFGSPPKPLPQLPYAETAARAISNLFKTEPLLGKSATKKEILAQLSSAKIIHFGTHGEFNDLQPLESGIALASEGEDGGFLTVGDILTQFAPPQPLSLNAELVVLSACSTGLGKITGDGVIGLARGLMAAGVKAVLVSLWEVQDFPTACFMVQFYKYFQGGNTPSEALKQAQVWLKNITNEELSVWMRQEKLSLNSIEKQNLKNWLQQKQKQGNSHPFQHPYYWGAFYLIGS